MITSKWKKEVKLPVEMFEERVFEQITFDYMRESEPDLSDHYMHIHTELELYYFVEGSVEYRVESSAYTLHPGDILIMRTGEAHCALVDPAVPYERFTCMFSPELLKETLNSRLLSPFLDRPLGVMNHYQASELPSSYIHQCITRMFLQQDNTSQMRPLVYLLGILQELYDLWNTKRHENSPDQSASLAMQIVSYINQHLLELQSPRQLEQQFFLSQSQLNRVFREFTGTSTWEYVRTKRLFAARELLQAGIRPQEAAAECGYQDYSTFYRAYRKQFGSSPQEEHKAFRKQ